FDGGAGIPAGTFTGSGSNAPPASPACPGNVASQAFDCGENDYFSPSPPAGSYLATHWNVQDSIYLCPLASCQTPDPALPVAHITVPVGGHSGQPVTFSAATSTGQRPLRYQWGLIYSND